MCRICQSEIETVEYLAINYIAEIRNSAISIRINQTLEAKGDGITE